MENGTAPLRAERNGRRVIRLGDTTPDVAAVEINGRELIAHVIGDAGYPQSVAAELDAAQQAYQRLREREEPLPSADVLEAAAALAEQVVQHGPKGMREQAEELKRLVGFNQRAPRYRPNPVAWEDYVTKCIMLMVPGITYEEADNLRPDARNKLLTDLGYFSPPAAPAADADAGGVVQSPPVSPQTSTGDSPVPDSATTIPV